MVLQVGRDWNVEILTAPSLRGNGATLFPLSELLAESQVNVSDSGRKLALLLTCGSMPEAPVPL